MYILVYIVPDFKKYAENMKRYLIFLTALFLCSCISIKKPTYNEKVTIFKKTFVNNYTLLYGVKNHDTVVYIMKTNLSENCKSDHKTITHKNTLKQISSIKSATDTIYFEYSIGNTNKNVGENEPSKNIEECIYTYSSYPYYIDSCEYFN